MGRRPEETKMYRWSIDTWRNTQHLYSSEKCKSKPKWDITLHLSQSLSSESLQITNVGEDVEKREPWCIVSGNVNWYTTMASSLEVSQKAKIELLYNSAIQAQVLWSLKLIQFDEPSLGNVIQKHLTFAQHECIEKAPPSSQEEACVQEEPGSLNFNSFMV